MPSDPNQENARMVGKLPSPFGTDPAKGALSAGSASAPLASDPIQENAQVRSLIVTDPGQDASQVMSAFLQEGCVCADREPGERPFGPPPLRVTQKAKDARAELRVQLFADVGSLVRKLNAAHLAGSITPSDLGMLHALQGWYSLLQAEQDLAKRKR